MLLRELHKQAQLEGGAVYMLNGNHESLNVSGNFRFAQEPMQDVCIDARTKFTITKAHSIAQHEVSSRSALALHTYTLMHALYSLLLLTSKHPVTS